MKFRVIAIDGPAASGKSSVSRGLAKQFGFSYLNSGSMYRAVTWYILHRDGNPMDPQEVQAIMASATLRTGIEGGASFLEIDGQRPGNELLDEDVNRSVSAVSTVPSVRERLVREFHQLAANGDLVVEGRDIGSVVFPDTPYKFYLDAPQILRQQRREAQGLKDEIAMRDRIDSSRHTAPLVIAPDAFVIDTGSLDLAGVIDAIRVRLDQLGVRPVQS